MIAREVSRYTVGAALAFAADVAVLALLVEVFGLHYLAAATVAFLVGSTVVYWVSIKYAFSFRRVADPRAEFSIFVALGLIGVMLNLACLYVAVDLLGLHYLVGKVGSACFTFIANFVMRRTLLFSDRQYVTLPGPWSKQ